MHCLRVSLTALLIVLLHALPVPMRAAEQLLLRGEVMARLDPTSQTLGELCVAGEGLVYAENERNGQLGIVSLNPEGKARWQTPVFAGTRPSSSAFGPCDATGVVYGVHASVGTGGRRGLVTRLSAAGAVEWTREIALPGCSSTYLFEVTHDKNGVLYIGGRGEGCREGEIRQGYVARLGADGAQLDIMRIEDLEIVRHVGSDGDQILAVGRGYVGGSAIISLAKDGTPRWIRRERDLDLAGSIEGVAAGTSGIHICSDDYRAKALILTRLDDQGRPAGSWSFANASVPTFANCLISSASRQELVLFASGSGSGFEVVRIPAGAAPGRGILIDNSLSVIRGLGVSDDGHDFFIGGPDSTNARSRTLIIRYLLP